MMNSQENKENVKGMGNVFDDIKNMSVDSLETSQVQVLDMDSETSPECRFDRSIGPALVGTTPSVDSTTGPELDSPPTVHVAPDSTPNGEARGPIPEENENNNQAAPLIDLSIRGNNETRRFSQDGDLVNFAQQTSDSNEQLGEQQQQQPTTTISNTLQQEAEEYADSLARALLGNATNEVDQVEEDNNNNNKNINDNLVKEDEEEAKEVIVEAEEKEGKVEFEEEKDKDKEKVSEKEEELQEQKPDLTIEKETIPAQEEQSKEEKEEESSSSLERPDSSPIEENLLPEQELGSKTQEPEEFKEKALPLNELQEAVVLEREKRAADPKNELVEDEEDNKEIVDVEKDKQEESEKQLAKDDSIISNDIIDLDENNSSNHSDTDESLTLPPKNNLINRDAYLSFQTAACNSVLADKLADMEFTKNYSDDLLMGQQQHQNDVAQQGEMQNADLADFELPPYSGSSSGSEPRQHSPIKRKSSSATSSAAIQPTSSHRTGSASPPSLCAVKDLLLSSYSRVSHVLSWKQPIESGIIFAIGATLILTLTFFSIISVIAYSALGIILTSGAIRSYKTLMRTLNRPTATPIDHIWEKVLSLEVSLSAEKLHELVESSHGNLNASMIYFKQVLLVEDKIATLKCAILLYLLTYIGSWFNGMTLITISYLALFLVPIMYEKNKTKIDEYANLVSGQLCSTISMVSNRASSMVFGSSSPASTESTGNKKNN